MNILHKQSRPFIVFFLFVLLLQCKKEEPAEPKPSADFSYLFITAGVLPTVVQFTPKDLSAQSYLWDFNDGTTSSEKSPRHNFTSAATFTVKLVVTKGSNKDSTTHSVAITLSKPKPDFTFTSRNSGYLPDTVNFTNTSTNASSLYWDFGNGDTSSLPNPQVIYKSAGTFKAKLVTANAAGTDSLTKEVSITLSKPKASFSFTASSLETLPVAATFANASSGSAVQYLWRFGNGDTSSQINPVYSYTAGGIYNITLVVSNAAGTDSITQQLKISPYLQAYTNFNGVAMNLYAWEGSHIVLLSRSKDLNRATMYKWLHAVDTAYGYYALCNGREPYPYTPTFINNRSTIADVASTCGAGCGYLGFTGIEMQNAYFDVMYNTINNNNQYDQVDFYELGRNFWFYGDKLAYKENDPVTTGYAIYMRFTSMKAAGVAGAPFGSLSFDQFKSSVEGLVDAYMANTTLTWYNTLGVGKGVPGGFGGGSDLFASFCMRLQRDYGDEAFVQTVWKQSALWPDAATTQDAVDNFIIASCAAANKNLAGVFEAWRWPVSDKAKTEAGKYP